MTNSEDIFDSQWDGFEESRCRFRYGRKIVSKAVMTASKKSLAYSDNGRTEVVSQRVKFRLSDLPEMASARGELCEIEIVGKFEKYRIAQTTVIGGIIMIDMEVASA